VALDDELSCATQRDDVAPPAGSRCMQLQWGERDFSAPAGVDGIWRRALGVRRHALIWTRREICDAQTALRGDTPYGGLGAGLLPRPV
jgi:hypothetical protein